MSFVPRVPAAAKERSDAEDARRCPRGTAFHPLELVARPGAETACPCRRARLAGRLLITNAIDSMAAKDGARVLCVRSEVHNGGGVIVSVADTGTGIGSQDFERIFNPLFTTKSGGMGLGLSICRSIIEAHDGRLGVAPNKTA